MSNQGFPRSNTKDASRSRSIFCENLKKALTNVCACAILTLANLGVAQMVARYLGVVEAAGSSPVTQTKKKHAKACFFGITTCSVVFDFSSKSDSFRLS